MKSGACISALLKKFALSAVTIGLFHLNTAHASDQAPAGDAPEYAPACAALSTDAKSLFLGCAAAGQVLVLDAENGGLKQAIPVPAPPSGMVLSKDGAQLFVTCAAADSLLCVIDVQSGAIVTQIPCGHAAMAPVLASEDHLLYVCDRFNNALGIVDLRERKELARIPVEREPVAAALSADGKLLFVANHLHGGRSDVGVVAASVSVLSPAGRKEIKRIPLCNGSTLLRGVCVSPDGKYVAVTHTLARFHLPTTHVSHGWMNDNALTLIDAQELKVVNTVLLDDVERGAANPWAVNWTADGKWILVTHAGTHELSRIDAPALLAKLNGLPEKLPQPAPAANAPSSTVKNDVPNDLAFLVGLRTRIQLPVNGPRALIVAGEKAWIPGYFSDSFSLINVPTGSVLRNLSLHSRPVELSLTRKGEMYFNDGTLCYQHWQSCASCHSSDARVDGMNWDLLNDGIGNPKNVKSLLLSFETGPAMAMGVRANAAVAVRAGIERILFARLPEEYPAAIDEYLKSLQPIPSPHLLNAKLSPQAERGRQLFTSPETGCTTCHTPPLFTDGKAHAVGTGKFDSQDDRFQTPTLLELWRTAPYLHDGSAITLRDVLKQNPNDHRGKTSHLTAEQLDDLAEYLLSL